MERDVEGAVGEMLRGEVGLIGLIELPCGFTGAALLERGLLKVLGEDGAVKERWGAEYVCPEGDREGAEKDLDGAEYEGEGAEYDLEGAEYDREGAEYDRDGAE